MEPKPEKQAENRPKKGEKTRFKPGQSGNPGGRPKGSVSITRHLREALEAQNEQKAKALALAIITEAAKGNAAALKIVMDRIDGPLVEKVDVTSAGEAVQFYVPNNGRDKTTGGTPGDLA